MLRNALWNVLVPNNMFQSCSRHPTVKWAQRSDWVYITVELPDAEDVKLKLEPEGKFFFSATSGASKTLYEVDLDLLDSVDVNVCADRDDGSRLLLVILGYGLCISDD